MENLQIEGNEIGSKDILMQEFKSEIKELLLDVNLLAVHYYEKYKKIEQKYLNQGLDKEELQTTSYDLGTIKQMRSDAEFMAA